MEYCLVVLAAALICVLITLMVIAIRITILYIRYRKWRKFSMPAIGIVGDLTNASSTYDRKGQITSTRYDYALKICCGDQEFEDVYFEVCKSDDAPMTRTGDKINILWSTNDHKYLSLDNFKPECRRITKQTFMFTAEVFLGGLSRNVRR